MTSRGIAGGHKQKYRFIDFKRRKWDVPATVERIEYDPNRTAFIALIKYEDGELAYILCPQRLGVGDTVVAGEKVDTKPGNAMLLGQMPVGTICHNVEMKPGKGGQIARSAGAYVQLVGRDRGMVIVRSPAVSPRTRSITRTAVVKAAPAVAVTRSPRGASRPRAPAPARTSRRTR